MFKFSVGILFVVLVAGCASNNIHRAEQLPVRIVKAEMLWTISTVGNVSNIPQSIGDRVASAGRDINIFNKSLAASAADSLNANLRLAGVKCLVIRAPSEDLDAQKKNRLFSTEKPNLFLVVSPIEVNTNIPFSFSGVFSASVFDVASGERLWEEHFRISRFATAYAHSEVGALLGKSVIDKLKLLGFI